MHRSQREVEIKIAVPHAARARTILKAAGYRPLRTVHEIDCVFDTPGSHIRGAGCLLRLRRAGRDWLLTFKGPAEAGARHKSREEIETAVGRGVVLAAIFARLGFSPVFRYEKKRTFYSRSRPEPGVVTLDRTPIGCYLELEGPPHWIDRTAARLGFTPADYITRSYGVLYLEHCRSRGVSPADMLFTRRKGRG